jgi:hypothetical protein
LIAWNGGDCSGVSITQAARAFTEDEMLFALELAGLGAFASKVQRKLVSYEAVKLADLVDIADYAALPDDGVLRIKKLLTDPVAREAAVKERDERERQRLEAEAAAGAKRNRDAEAKRNRDAEAAAEAQRKRDAEASAEAQRKRDAEAVDFPPVGVRVLVLFRSLAVVFIFQDFHGVFCFYWMGL